MDGYRYFYFGNNVINDSLADARFFANSCLALNFGWVLVIVFMSSCTFKY